MEKEPLNIMRSLQAQMTAEEINHWNELCRNGAPKDVLLLYAEKMLNKYMASPE